MIELNTVELDVLKEIVNIGLSKSADSLSFFIKEKVLIKDIVFSIGEVRNMSDFTEDKQGKLSVLETMLKGELTGGCYLMFDDQEVSFLGDICVPESITDPEARKEMGREMLLEIDNIIAGSIITQFSNLLSLQIHGDVPKLLEWDSAEVATNLQGIAKNLGTEYILQFDTFFRTEQSNIKPAFVWVLEDNFLERVKSFIDTSNYKSILESVK